MCVQGVGLMTLIGYFGAFRVWGARGWVIRLKGLRCFAGTPRVQLPYNHLLSEILTYITTILKPNI